MRGAKWLLMGVAWIAAVSAGVASMLRYEMTPAATDSVPQTWPAATTVHRNAERPTLVMFLHPQCPCSRASLDELLVLVTHCRDQVDPVIVFLKPSGFADGWEETDLWSMAKIIPGAALLTDSGGTETRRFHARVSGEALLYDVGGRLIFHGGLTPSRGHRGDNAGRSALELLLAGKPCPQRETAVFGCSLQEQDAGGKPADRPTNPRD
jgi:hypothetical protein